MTSDNIETKTIEELANSLTLEQVKEQMALYHRLYHKLRKEQDPEYIKRKNEKERERYLDCMKTVKYHNSQQPLI